MLEESVITKTRSALVLGAFAGAVVGAASLGGGNAGATRWYRHLKKAPFTPPDAVFPPVWTILYGLMAVSGWRVWRQAASPDRSAALKLWTAQLGLNGAWSWLFFKRHRPTAALVDLLGMHALISAYLARARKVDRPAAWMLAPYLAWVSFAGILNEEIVRRNR